MPSGSWRRLTSSALAVVLATAGLSHGAARWLGIAPATINRLQVRPGPEPPAAILGSSIALYAIAHERLARALHRPLHLRLVPSGSPAELESLQDEVRGARPMLICVSPWDLNELVVAESRPALVPLSRTLADLRDVGADWPFTRRVVGQYLVHGARLLLPTAGRSSLVMVGIRSRFRGQAATADGDADGVVAFDPAWIPDDERGLDAWSPGERLRALANARATGRAEHAFGGPKARALRRMASVPGAVVVVLPVSPSYEREFLGPARVDFARVIDGLAPARVLRLDHDDALRTDAAFRDLVHIGPVGRRHVTAAVARALGTP